ncbi:MAG: hybrid sensor histidine kinase/response regulator [Methylococcus sp.]|nr:hybrid sensor histidine kinase/response regulator [Methylococcus sp.]
MPGTSTESSALNRLDRIRAEQIAALYRNAPLGVFGAGVAGAVLAYVLIRTGTATATAIMIWLGVLWTDVAAHLLLWQFRRRAGQRDVRWRFWAGGFTLVSLAEGITWGWCSLGLVSPHQIDQQIWVMLVTSGVASGAATAFGSYLPAFFALMVPAMAPYLIWSIGFGSGLGQALGALDLIYIAAMSTIAWRSNASFVDALRLRFETIDLAERLSLEKERAEQANLAKTRFLASANHDLRQPVHALGMFVGALRSCAMDAEARRILEHIDGSIQAMDALFTSLLDISRLDAGVIQPRLQAVHLQPLLDRISRDHLAEAASRGIRLTYVPSTVRVLTDPALLERILRNLVLNALRHADAERILIGCRRGKRLSIEVWDNGCGIPVEQQTTVFQEFYQIGNPERDRAKGLGLGLAIVKRLSEILDHPLTLISTPGEGSVFKISAPLMTDMLPEMPDIQAPAMLRLGLILVIDDEAAIRDAMETLLSSWGHTVITAASCDELLERISDCPRSPDIVLCDYRLRNGDDGIDAIRRLQSKYPAVPGVLITGDSAPDRLQKARECGLVLLHKPVPNSRLRATIGHLMTHSRNLAREPVLTSSPTVAPRLPPESD